MSPEAMVSGDFCIFGEIRGLNTGNRHFLMLKLSVFWHDGSRIFKRLA